MTKLRGQRDKNRTPRYALRMAGIAMLLTAIGLFSLNDPARRPAAADEAAKPHAAAPRVGYLVRVPLPLVGDADSAVRTQIRRVLDTHRKNDAGKPPVLVLQFGRSDSDETGAATEIGSAYNLANFLTGDDLRGVHTVAALSGKLEGHALLAIMACREIVALHDAELVAIAKPKQPITDAERGMYEKIEGQRHTLPAVVALSLLDPAVSAVKVEHNDGVRWMTAAEAEEAKQAGKVSSLSNLWQNNDPRVLTADELRQYSFVTHVASDTAELTALLKLSDLTTDPAFAGDWRAIRVDLHGTINETLVTQAQRAIDEAMQHGENAGEPINFICLSIDSAGGSATDSISLINHLEGLDHDRVHVSAYIPRAAHADAAIVAMACDSIAMGPRALLGGSGDVIFSAGDRTDLVDRIRTLNKARGERWSLWAAMVLGDKEIRTYTREGTNDKAYFSAAEYDEQPNKEQWIAGDVYLPKNTTLNVNSGQALELGLIDHEVASYRDYLQIYGLENEPRLVERNFAHLMVDGMRQSPFLPWLLVFLGVVAMMIELSSPGVGVPGFVSLVCFVLFFWLMALNGTATSLEILLFVVGVVCVAVEIFLLPGFGAFGLGGGALIIVALVLASQTFVIPRNEYQLERLPYSLLTVVAAGAGVIAGAFLMRRFVERTPGLRWMMLEPPSGEEQSQLSERESLANFTHLHGKRGFAATRLTPSGKAKFGDETVNVISRGQLVDKGTDVMVVDVQGSIVVVEPIE